jgi:CheY-like chemotaxis protein
MTIGRALRAGADEVLLKPYDRAALVEKFEDLGLVA